MYLKGQQVGEFNAGVVSPKVSLESPNSSRLTYIRNQRDVMVLYLDNSGIIQKDKIMSLEGLTDSMIINELWVFQ